MSNFSHFETKVTKFIEEKMLNVYMSFVLLRFIVMLIYTNWMESICPIHLHFQQILYTRTYIYCLYRILDSRLKMTELTLSRIYFIWKNNHNHREIGRNLKCQVEKNEGLVRLFLIVCLACWKDSYEICSFWLSRNAAFILSYLSSIIFPNFLHYFHVIRTGWLSNARSKFAPA